MTSFAGSVDSLLISLASFQLGVRPPVNP